MIIADLFFKNVIGNKYNERIIFIKNLNFIGLSLRKTTIKFTKMKQVFTCN